MVCTATAQIPKEKIICATAAANLRRDIFCVSLLCSPSLPHVQDANSDAAVIEFLKFQCQIGEEVWLEMAFSPSRDLVFTMELKR